MVTTRKSAGPATEAATKRTTTKPAPVKPVVAKSTTKAAPAPEPVKSAPKKATATKKAVPAPAKSAPKKTAAPKKAAPAPKPVISTIQRNHYVEVAAFYIAERRGFAAANPADDWMAAEAEIDRLIASGHFTP